MVIDRNWWKTFFDTEYLAYHLGRPQEDTEAEIALIQNLLGPGEGRLLLDACCGYGRHSIPLSALGWRVTGLDYSSGLLGLAQQKALRTDKVSHRLPFWVRGDLRKIPFPPVFDAAICMFTSLGYCEKEADHRAMIRSLADSLKEDGLLLLDVGNRDFLVQHPDVVRNWWQRGEETILEETIFDPVTSRATTTCTLIGADGGKRHSQYRIRLFSFHELAGILFNLGFAIEAACGGYQQQPPRLSAKRIILLARKIQLALDRTGLDC